MYRADNSREDVSKMWLGKEGTKETTKERRAKFVTHILANETVPHMALGVDERALKKKAIFSRTRRDACFALHTGSDAIDDRDDYSLKRVDASGMLISLLFRQLFRQFLKQTSVAHAKLIEKGTIDTVNLGDVLTQRKITSGIRHAAFSTGSWVFRAAAGRLVWHRFSHVCQRFRRCQTYAGCRVLAQRGQIHTTSFTSFDLLRIDVPSGNSPKVGRVG